MTFDDFKALARRTLRDPEGAARWLIDQRWPMQVRWMALVLAVSLSGLLAYGSTLLFPLPSDEGAAVFSISRQPLVPSATLATSTAHKKRQRREHGQNIGWIAKPRFQPPC